MQRLFRISYLLIAMLLIYGGLSAAGTEKAEMTFTETIHDFGNVKENGGPVSVEFPFTNTGGANLVVYDATAECGCTTPEYPKAPVAPGKTGSIKVTYNPLGRPGIFEKVITVRCNGKKGKLRLKIRGTVLPKSRES